MSDNLQRALDIVRNLPHIANLASADKARIGSQACDILKSSVDAGMYPSLQGKVRFYTDYEFVDDNNINVNLYFDPGSLYRPSLNPNNPGAYDIVGLFTNGWTIGDEVRMPYAKWFGSYITGRRSFQGDNFLLRSGESAGAKINGIKGAKFIGLDCKYGGK